MHYNFNETKERRIYNNVGTGSDVKTYLQWKEHVVDQHKNAHKDETKNFIKFLNAKKRKHRVRNEISLGMILPLLILIITLFSSHISAFYSQMEQLSELKSEYAKFDQDLKLKNDEIIKALGEEAVYKAGFVNEMTEKLKDFEENINRYYNLLMATFFVTISAFVIIICVYRSGCKKVFFLEDYIEILEDL